MRRRAAGPILQALSLVAPHAGMPSSSQAATFELTPFPTRFRASREPGAVAAMTLLESFANRETVAMVEARPHWEYQDSGDPVHAVFDVVSARREDPDTCDTSTSLGAVPVRHGEIRRFLVGIPVGHKLVVYPGDTARGAQVVGAAQDSFLRVTVMNDQA